ncbi:hypothetical protein B0H12DRAFT_1154867, partial [Mycena haematopus]
MPTRSPRWRYAPRCMPMSARVVRSGSFFPCSRTSHALRSMSLQIKDRWLRHLILNPTPSLMCANA